MTYLDPASEILRQITAQGYTPPTPQLAFAQTMQGAGLTGGVQPTIPPPVEAPSFLSGATRPARQLAPSAIQPGAAPTVRSIPRFGLDYVTAGADDSAAAVGRRALPGVLNRVVQQPNASGIQRFLRPGINLPGWLTGASGKGGLIRGAIPGVAAAFLADPIAERIIPGDNEQAESALANAAKGAALGSVFGPWGTAIGGVGGAALTALGVFGDSGPKTEDDRELLNEAIATSGLDPDARDEILTVYNTLYSLARNDEEKAAAFDTVKQLLTEQVLSADEDEQLIETMLASQAMTQQFLSPITQGIVSSAEQQRDIALDIANTLPPEFRGPAILAANQRVESANRIAGAYANQMSSIPQLTALQLEQQRQQSVAPDQTTAELQSLLAGLGASG